MLLHGSAHGILSRRLLPYGVAGPRLTAEFLAFSVARGNDLVTPRPEFGFAGLEPGDRWCLCVARWAEALEAGVAPPVFLSATHERALDVVTLAQLQAHALAS